MQERKGREAGALRRQESEKKGKMQIFVKMLFDLHLAYSETSGLTLANENSPLG